MPPRNRLQIYRLIKNRLGVSERHTENSRHCRTGVAERHFITTPFWTLKPSWYLVSGRLILTSTTGGQGTTVSLTTVADFAFYSTNANATDRGAVRVMEWRRLRKPVRYLDVGLARRQRKADQADAVDGNDLIADVELATTGSRSSRSQVGNDHSGKHGAPARLDDHHAQDFVSSLRNYHLRQS